MRLKAIQVELDHQYLALSLVKYKTMAGGLPEVMGFLKEGYLLVVTIVVSIYLKGPSIVI